MCRGNLALRTDLPRRTADVREEALVLGARALDQVCAVRAPRALTAGELGGWMVGWLETASGRTSFPSPFPTNPRSNQPTHTTESSKRLRGWLIASPVVVTHRERASSIG